LMITKWIRSINRSERGGKSVSGFFRIEIA
jgi:hypothetical protein